MASDEIAITRVEVRNDRLSLLLQWPSACPRDTNERLIAALPEDYRDLSAHSCVNDVGTTFGDVINDTPLPHLLEHMIISNIVRDPQTPKAMLMCGTSEWLDEKNGVARVEVAIADDLVALRATRSALAALNAVLR